MRYRLMDRDDLRGLKAKTMRALELLDVPEQAASTEI